jgi:hypothetical protein
LSECRTHFGDSIKGIIGRYAPEQSHQAYLIAVRFWQLTFVWIEVI